jgi:alkylation response protein AidB-like acyl-CoA dehydrogenase
VNPGFDLFTLPEEHELLRRTVQDLAADKIAPRAAEIDEAAEFPWDVHAALVAADLHAVHVPEEYGGVGADAIACAIVIEEIARVCASSSLIPAVNKLGTTGLILAGDEAIKSAYLSKLAAGDGMFSYCLSEPDAGSDAANLKTRADRDGESWVLNGVKRWITNAGV